MKQTDATEKKEREADADESNHGFRVAGKSGAVVHRWPR